MSEAATAERVQDLPGFAGHSPQQERPLGGYAVLMGSFAALTSAFGLWVVRSGRELPEGPSARDLALVTVATHKTSRLLTKDRVTSAARAPFTRFVEDAGPSEASEEPRGRGLRRAVGELVVCPYCLGLWIAAAFAAGLIAAPRPTRWIAGIFSALFGADVLQLSYKKLEDMS